MECFNIEINFLLFNAFSDLWCCCLCGCLDGLGPLRALAVDLTTGVNLFELVAICVSYSTDGLILLGFPGSSWQKCRGGWLVSLLCNISFVIL